MLKREYIVFAAFLLINGMLAVNCFTWLANTKRDEIAKSNYEEKSVVIRNNKPRFPSTNLILVPDAGALWNSKNQLQISFSFPTVNHFCVQIENQRNEYKNPEIKDCDDVQKNNQNPFYKLKAGLINQIFKKHFLEFTELVVNTKYPDDLVFVRKDNSYILINADLEFYQNRPKSYTLSAKDSFLKEFLDNKDNTIQRQKINTMFEVQLFGSKFGYVTFQNIPSTKNRVVTIEWSYQEIVSESKIPQFILLTLLLPFTVILDLVLLPFAAILFILYIILLK